MNINEKIDWMLQMPGWNQARLARETGLGASRISKWVANKGEPNFSQASLIARCFGISTEVLIDDNIDIEKSRVVQLGFYLEGQAIKDRILELASEIGYEVAEEFLIELKQRLVATRQGLFESTINRAISDAENKSQSKP